MHMSNFGFAWVWKEWCAISCSPSDSPMTASPTRVPDIQLSVRHPKRRFVRQALEYEIRLSYFDRILKTLPEAMQSPEAQCMPEEAPGPEYEYDDPCE